ncbi:DEAD-box ATP-dependent RNA helicase CshA [Leifsonia rubra CMS 76R]|nr:DEAD-box ATP-dependent RNA helicase CshA [Leifsonia rubra CMS 76R]
MPNFNKPATGRGNKNFKSAPKGGGGARSEGHRGFRADQGEAPKRRWSADDRAARTGDRKPGAARGGRDERRPDWTPREKPARGGRPETGNRGERPSYGDRPQRNERGAYGDRPQRDARPDRGARPSYSDRNERPQRTERPSYNDRAGRGASTGRSERPAYNDRPQRTERPSYNDRAQRTERPSYGDRNDRGGRPSYNDRAQRSEPRESSYYPNRDAKSSHSQQEDVVLERLVAKAVTASEVEGKSFLDLGIGSNISRQLASMGAESPFPIQAATIPDVLAGTDVLGRGKTGSGKTIAFGAPLVERLMENNGGKDRQMGRKPRALILAPTRELAQQIDRTIQPIARSVGLFTTTIVGGVPQYKQVAALTRGVDVIIATPGRVEDLIEQGRLDLSQVKVTVLDEADHMCDLGFLEPVQRILRETSEGGQKLLFSATLDKGVATLVKEFLVDPAVHEVAGEDQASSTIDHKVLLIEQREKRAIIKQLAAGDGKTLVFTRTRAFAEEMAEFLSMSGTPATSLHGDLNQSRRTRNLQMLTSGKVNVLVATDVAARGIHVDDISLVIQADAPEEYKTYLHRSGRTGRAGKVGTVVTLVNRNRRRKMDELLGRAEIDAESIDVAAGDAVIDDLAAL